MSDSPRFRVLGPHNYEAPNTSEYRVFEQWWQEHVKTLNQRANLVWQEIAWAGWFARSEIAEGQEPTVFPRRGPSD